LNALLQEAYDLHVHSAPDVLPRKMDDIEMAKRIISSGMKGYAIKSHFICTSERAELIRKMFPACHAIGTITLNSAAGGINPMAVEIAGRSGARLVWFPTVDSQHERESLVTYPPDKLPYWAKILNQMKAEGINSPTIYILKNGKLMPEVFDVLDIIAKYKMILATSHLSKEEAFALVKAAQERKVERIMITHADFPSTFYTVEEQKQFLKYGAYIEHCYNTPATGKVPWETVVEQIRGIGAKHVVLTTDLGHTTGAFPDEGLALFAQKLLEKGFNETEIRTMMVNNPALLVK
jgi:hypothetical protein